jgi:hypothetical protein
MPRLDSQRREFLRELPGDMGAELNEQEGEARLLSVGGTTRSFFMHGLILSLT